MNEARPAATEKWLSTYLVARALAEDSGHKRVVSKHPQGFWMSKELNLEWAWRGKKRRWWRR